MDAAHSSICCTTRMCCRCASSTHSQGSIAKTNQLQNTHCVEGHLSSRSCLLSAKAINFCKSVHSCSRLLSSRLRISLDRCCKSVSNTALYCGDTFKVAEGLSQSDGIFAIRASKFLKMPWPRRG